MIPSIKYLSLTIRHKWFVLIAGLKIGCSLWRLILHDMSKFYPSELPHYGKQFFGSADSPHEFIRCWVKHQNRNDHHWEYWIPRTGHNRCTPPYQDNEPIEMPREAILEMIADWMGASRAYEGKFDINDWPWFDANLDQIRLHPVTRNFIVDVINTQKVRSFY